MRKWVAASTVGLVAVVGGPPVLSSAFSAGGDPVGAQQVQPADPEPDVDPHSDSDSTSAEPDDDAADDAQDSPSWAHSQVDVMDHGKRHGTKHGSLDAWKKLTPAQRASTMARLIEEHTAGMKRFTACRAAGRDDCVPPLPPGLAKRR